jgi:hypothetical protein
MFNWKILEIFVDCKGVKYFVSATDGKNTVETEGNHWFSDGIVNKSLNDCKESDLIGWLQTDTTKDDINHIKLNLEKQLAELKKETKVGLPWLANTFKVQI